MVLASNKENLNFAGNEIPGLDESGPEQDMVNSEVIKRGQDSPVDYKSRGISYLETGQIDDAISDLNKAIKLNPGYDDAYVRKGYIYFRRGNYYRAIENNTKALELNPDNALAKKFHIIYSEARQPGVRAFISSPY